MERSFALGLVVAFPLLASALTLFGAGPLRRWLGEDRGKVAAVYLSLFGSSMALFFLLQAVFGALTDARIPSLVDELGPWLSGESLAVQRRLVLDPLASAFALSIAATATLVQIFAVGWAGERDDGHRVFAWIGALESATLLLVLAGSSPLVMLAWGSMGLLAHLGIGAAGTVASRVAARRQLLFEALGMSALFVGVFALFRLVPSFELDSIRLAAAPGTVSSFRDIGALGIPVAELAVGAFALAALVRVGLLPVHGGLEASAHAPLPQLGLMQAAGLLGATYLVVRLEALVALAPIAMGTMAALGLLGAVVGAFVALGESRIDRILTYSSLSHAGLVFAALGMGAWAVAGALAVAHAVAKVGLALACAAGDGDVHEQRVDRTRVHGRAIGQASFWLCASLAGLVPTAGFFALADVTVHVLTDMSAFSVGINYAGFMACLLAGVGGTAAIFRLHYRVFARSERAPEPGPDQDAYTFAVVVLAVLAVGLGLLWVPELSHQTRVLEHWIAPQTRVSAGFGRGGHEAFALGPSAAWVAEGGRSAQVLWLVLLGVVVATSGTWWRGRVAWIRGATRAAGPLGHALALAQRVVELERGAWRALARFADALSTLAHFGVDEIACDRGSAMGGRAGAELGRLFAGWGTGSGRRAVVAMLLGAAFVLGWVYFKPSVASWGPSPVHDFGGLRPGLQGPAQSEGGAARDEDATEASAEEAP